MKNSKFFLLVMAMLLCSISTSAEAVLIDGFWYNFRGNLADMVKDPNGGSYSGDIIIPSTVTYKGVVYDVFSIGEYVFSGCSGLTSINIPESVSSIEESAFSGCSSLTSINIPKRVNMIRDGVFSGCSSLTTINIPEGVGWIGAYAFHGCSSLTSINIPESVTKIGYSAFINCTKVRLLS